MVNYLKIRSKSEQNGLVNEVGNGDGKLVLWKGIHSGAGFPCIDIQVIEFIDWSRSDKDKYLNISISHKEDTQWGFVQLKSKEWKKELKSKLLKDLDKEYNRLKKEINKL